MRQSGTTERGGGNGQKGSVRKVHLRSCHHRQRCTCGGRGTHTKPCPKAQRCRREGRSQARITTPKGATVTATSTFKAHGDAEEWVKSERAPMEDRSAYVIARLQAAKEQARLDAINTFAVHAER